MERYCEKCGKNHDYIQLSDEEIKKFELLMSKRSVYNTTLEGLFMSDLKRREQKYIKLVYKKIAKLEIEVRLFFKYIKNKYNVNKFDIIKGEICSYDKN